jgi:hypothetical protein
MISDYKVLIEKLVDEMTDLDEKEKQTIKDLAFQVLDLERQYEFNEDRPRIKKILDDIL